jgi:hypothetical protein
MSLAQSAPKLADAQRPDEYWSIVTDLMSLIHRMRGYQMVNEAGRPAEFFHEAVGDVVILDDVTPARPPEAQMLDDCNLRLRKALHFLFEARAARLRAENSIERINGSDHKASNLVDMAHEAAEGHRKAG